MRLKAISLFAGAGGLDVGIDQAGFKTICSIELDPHCATTLRNNAVGKTIWQVDIRALDAIGASKALDIKPGDLALLHGGPPCQPFSQIGKKGGISDPRGQLAFEMVRFAEALRPAAIMIEQVPQFLQAKATESTMIVDVLSEAFWKIGYELRATILDAVDFKVPQRRKRAIVVCVPKGLSFEFPFDLKETQPTTVGEAIGDLPAASLPGQIPLAPNHIDVTPARDRHRISYVLEGQWLSKTKDAPADVVQRLTPKDSTKFRRLHRELPSLTLRCGEMPYHPLENRYVTPREAARIQGFPDRYIFTGPIRRRTGTVSSLDQHRQIANAVPPPLAKSVASGIKSSLCL